MSEKFENIDESINEMFDKWEEESNNSDSDELELGEESIEELFNQFVEAIKNLPEKDKDAIYNNLKEMEENKDID